jgi:acetoin utilization protein AcuB
MTRLLVRSHMTPSPLTIGSQQTLETAEELMRTHHIRHLPVLEGGRLVGVVSARDLKLVESLPGIDPATVKVEEAMTSDVYSVSPGSSLEWVATELAARKLGSAVVVEQERVVGVFTTIDALRALSELLGELRRERQRQEPHALHGGH